MQVLLLFTLLIASIANADFNLDLLTDFDIFAQLGGVASYTGNVNIGTFAILDDVVASVSSSVSISGTMTLGSSGLLLNSNPLLNIQSGSTLTVDALVIAGGAVAIAADAALIVTGATSVTVDTIIAGPALLTGTVDVAANFIANNITVVGDINIDADASFIVSSGDGSEAAAVISGNINGAGSLGVDANAVLAIASDTSVAISSQVEVLASGAIYAGSTTVFNGAVNLYSGSVGIIADAGATVTFNVDSTINSLVLVQDTATVVLNGNVSGAGDIRIYGSATINQYANTINSYFGLYADATATVAADAYVSFSQSAYVTVNETSTFIINGYASFGEIKGQGEVQVNGAVELASDVEASLNVAATGNAVITASSADYSGEVYVAGTLAVDTASYAYFYAETTVTSSASVVVAASGRASFAADVSGSGTIDASGYLYFDSTASVSAAESITVAAVVHAHDNVDARITGAVTFANEYHARATTVESDAWVYFQGHFEASTLTLNSGSSLFITSSGSGDNQNYIYESLTISASASLYVNGSLEFNATVYDTISGNGHIIFSSDTEEESTFASSSVSSDVTVTGSAILTVATEASAEATIYGSVFVRESAEVAIDSASAISITGDIYFEADSTLTLNFESEDSTSIATVEGEATFDGTLVVNLAEDLSSDVEVVVIAYGSRADESVFASLEVNVGNKKRQSSDYEITYGDDSASIRNTGGSTDDTGSDSSILTLAVASLLVLAL